MKSIIQDREGCYFCGKLEPLQEHHIMNGPKRPRSTKYGLTVMLCVAHHNEIHSNQVLDEYLKRIAQEKFEHKFDHTLWMREFSKNYL